MPVELSAEDAALDRELVVHGRLDHLGAVRDAGFNVEIESGHLWCWPAHDVLEPADLGNQLATGELGQSRRGRRSWRAREQRPLI